MFRNRLVWAGLLTFLGVRYAFYNDPIMYIMAAVFFGLAYYYYRLHKKEQAEAKLNEDLNKTDENSTFFLNDDSNENSGDKVDGDDSGDSGSDSDSASDDD